MNGYQTPFIAYFTIYMRVILSAAEFGTFNLSRLIESETHTLSAAVSHFHKLWTVGSPKWEDC